MSEEENVYSTGYVQMYRSVLQEINNRCGYGYAELYYTILSFNMVYDYGTGGKSVINQYICVPSYGKIMDRCNISLKTLKTKLKKLVDTGCLQIVSGKQGVSNNYYFPLEPFYEESTGTILAIHGDKKVRVSDIKRKKQAFKSREQ